MLKTREDISVIIQKELKKYLLKPSKQKEIAYSLEEKFNIPKDIAFSLTTMQTRPEDYSDFVIFALVNEVRPEQLDKIFTPSEIKTYSEAKFKQAKLKFPLKWKMAEVIEGQQWIGVIKLSDLMLLRNNSLIRYNEDTQRTMKRIISGDTCYYEITLDRRAVNSIKNAVESDQYIPTTLTFNLSEDADFYYKDGELVIKKCDFLDIVDGYHRYIALSKIYDANPKFDFNMELRITSFSESRAKQFIWQEDQKTKMRKVDSESLNQTNPAVKIVQQLNTDANFILAGKMNRTDGIINIGDFTSVISDLFYSSNQKKQLNKSNEIKYQQEVKKKLLEGINKYVEENTDKLDKQIEYAELVILCYCILRNIDKSNIVVSYIASNKDIEKSIIPASKKISQSNLTKIDNLIMDYLERS